MQLVFHGTKTPGFKKFDYEKIRTNGTSEGIGFYFTDSVEVAQRYKGEEGEVIPFLLDLQKGLSSTEITLTRRELKILLIKLHQKGEYLCNYGEVEYEGLNKVVNTAIDNLMENETDLDIIGDITSAYGEFETPLVTLYEELGYTHSKIKAEWGNQNIYLAFVNDIIHEGAI